MFKTPTMSNLRVAATRSLVAWGSIHASSYLAKKASLDSPVKTGIASVAVAGLSASLKRYKTLRTATTVITGMLVARTVSQVWNANKPDTSSEDYTNEDGDKNTTGKVIDEVDDFVNLGGVAPVSGTSVDIGAIAGGKAERMTETVGMEDLEGLPSVDGIVNSSEPVAQVASPAQADGVEKLRS
jgi:hypothetical protein